MKKIENNKKPKKLKRKGRIKKKANGKYTVEFVINNEHIIVDGLSFRQINLKT